MAGAGLLSLGEMPSCGVSDNGKIRTRLVWVVVSKLRMIITETWVKVTLARGIVTLARGRIVTLVWGEDTLARHPSTGEDCHRSTISFPLPLTKPY